MSITPSFELTLIGRIILAAIAGSLIGLEREIHAHPAGMRTHLLVSVGAASFTILSMHGFGDMAGQASVDLDPSRVSAQIVSGIGFIGGGAILKYGATIRGLTTAGSLWATASVGFAFGSGLFLFGSATALLIVISLWPLNWLIDSVRRRRQSTHRIRLALGRLDTLSEIYGRLRLSKVDVLGIDSERIGKGQYEVGLDLRIPAGLSLATVVLELAQVGDVEILDSGAHTE